MPRPRIPVEDHAWKGTRPQYTKPEADGTIRPGRPKMPATLTGVAEERWREMNKILRQRRTLTRADGPLLEQYCVAYARWVDACKELASEGLMVTESWTDKDGNEHSKRVVNPLAKIVNSLETQCRQMLQQFGCTPASREKTKQLMPKPAAPVDPMEDRFGAVNPAPEPPAPAPTFDDIPLEDLKL